MSKIRDSKWIFNKQRAAFRQKTHAQNQTDLKEAQQKLQGTTDPVEKKRLETRIEILEEALTTKQKEGRIVKFQDISIAIYIGIIIFLIIIGIIVAILVI